MLGSGKVPESWWDDIPKLTNQRERVGYPTQKPLALLQRIIRACSEPGSLVFDPFCGCGTTIEAAHGLGREWIGIDICVKACQVIEERLRRSFDVEWADIEFKGMPKTRDHAAKLATVDPFQFERWAASLTPWMEWNKRPVADKGIDGEGRYPLRKGQFAKMVAQVKGGHTQPRDIQAFNGARRQARADMGIFTCFEDRVTQGMRDAAASAGRFMEAPVIQIYTVEDFFNGRQPQLPRAA
jgi:site-specific DNA-methyltransferase (adenine-specific)